MLHRDQRKVGGKKNNIAICKFPVEKRMSSVNECHVQTKMVATQNNNQDPGKDVFGSQNPHNFIDSKNVNIV